MTPEQLAALQDSATRPRRTVPVVLDGDLREQIELRHVELEALQAAEQAAKEKPRADRRLGYRPPGVDTKRAAEIEAELEPLYAAAEGKTLDVVVEGMAGTPWQAMLVAYPPREGVNADTLWRFNTSEGRAPLIQQTAIGYKDGDTVHDWAPGQLEWLLGWATDWVLDKLLLAALGVCRGDDAVPLPLPRSTTRSSDAA